MGHARPNLFLLVDLKKAHPNNQNPSKIHLYFHGVRTWLQIFRRFAQDKLLSPEEKERLTKENEDLLVKAEWMEKVYWLCLKIKYPQMFAILKYYHGLSIHYPYSKSNLGVYLKSRHTRFLFGQVIQNHKKHMQIKGWFGYFWTDTLHDLLFDDIQYCVDLCCLV